MAKHLKDSRSARRRRGRNARAASSQQRPTAQVQSRQQQNAQTHSVQQSVEQEPSSRQTNGQVAQRRSANGLAPYQQPGAHLAVRQQRSTQMHLANVNEPQSPMRYNTRMPYGMPAAYRIGYNEAMPNREFTWGDKINQRGGIYSFLRGLLLSLAWVFRIAALSVAAIVVLNGLSLPVFRSTLAQVTDTIISFVPWPNIGRFTVDTPFGGVFRGDLALITLLLFTMDWLLCRSRAALR